MLYDPKWEQKTKADPLSIEALIAWLETKPASEPYSYRDNCRCLLGQYFSEMYGRRVNVGLGSFWFYSDETTVYYPPALDRIASKAPLTFGAALKRARAAVR